MSKLEGLPPPIAFPLSDGLFLFRQVVSVGAKAAPKPAPVHHLILIDCSGSMSNDLPAVRMQLKNKLPKLIKEDDVVSLIWFSGKDQYGALVEAEKVRSLTDLNEIHRCIDRWLKPVGMTGFKEPLEKAFEIVLSRRHTSEVFSLFFMSDGCDNQWPKSDIMRPLGELAKLCSSATFVEYGYYADRQMLASMAERAGGVHVFAQDFPSYEPIFEHGISKGAVADNLRVIPTMGAPTSERDIAFAYSDGDLYSFAINGGSVMVSDRHPEIWYIAKAAEVRNLPTATDGFVESLYAALSLYSLRMRSDLIFPILKALGDVRIINEFAGCFGKQKYTAFMQMTTDCVWKQQDRFTRGRSLDYLPADDAFTIWDLLNRLNDDDTTRLLLDHRAFKYSRISRAKATTDEILPPEVQQQMTELSEKLAKAKTKTEISGIQSLIVELSSKFLDRKGITYKVVPVEDGYPINDLVFNEERPNISTRVKKDILLDLQPEISRVADETLKAALLKLPNPFPSYIWRNYAVIKDGLVNVSLLPIQVSSPQLLQFIEGNMAKTGVVGFIDKSKAEVVFDLERLPLLNRKMVKAVSAKTMFELEWKLCQLRAAQKVYNHFQKESAPKTSKGYSMVYGQAVADWLQSFGITDYNGYNPAQVSVPATDCYYSKTLEVSLKGYASLPTVKEVIERIAKADAGGKPLTGGAMLMAPAIKNVLAKQKTAKDSHFTLWISGEQQSAVAETRMALLEKAKMVFAIVVGQVWFKEWATLEENTMKVLLAGMPAEVEGKIEMKEEEIRI